MIKKQLFCISYAGGVAKYFYPLKISLDGSGIDVIPIEYAGHGIRIIDNKYNSFNEMSGDVYRVIKEKRIESCDYALFGYSMGALVAFDVINRLLSQSDKQRLLHFFIAAHEPPNIPFRGKKYVDLDDDDFISEMIKLGGIDSRLIANKRFLKLYINIIRNDYKLINDYNWNGKYTDIGVGITSFYCEQDISEDHITQWRKFTTKSFDIKSLLGNHFFLHENINEISDTIRRTLN